MKSILIDMDFCLPQFDALIFFLGVRLHGKSIPNFDFFNVKPQIRQRKRKVHYSNYLDVNFSFLTLVCRLLDVEFINNASFQEEKFFS